MDPTPFPPPPGPFFPLDPLPPIINSDVQYFLDRVPDVILLGAGLLVAAFAVIYRVFFEWDATPAGRALGRLSASLAAVLLVITASIVFGQSYPFRWLVRGITYSWVLYAAAELLVVLLRSGRRPADPIIIRPKTRPGDTVTDFDVPAIVHKGQRVLRTIVQTGIPTFLSFAVVLPLIIDALGLPVTSSLYLWLVGVAAGVTAVAAALARVMAIPAVNRALTRIGLGSVPRAPRHVR